MEPAQRSSSTQRRLQIEGDFMATVSGSGRDPGTDRDRACVLDERAVVPAVRVPAAERVRAACAVLILGHGQTIATAGVIVDRGIGRRVLDKRLDHQKSTTVDHAWHLVDREGLSGRRHSGIGAGADGDVEISDADAGVKTASIVAAGDAAEVVAKGEIRSIRQLAVGAQTEEVLLRKYPTAALQLDE